MVTPQDVTRAARAYLGVRFRHQGRSRHGLDCIGLCIRVAHDLGISDADVAGYPRLPHRWAVLEGLRAQCEEVRGAPAVGMVALMSFDGMPTHTGIIGDHPHGGLSLIHAYVIERRVIEHRIDRLWRSRIVALFEMPGMVR